MTKMKTRAKRNNNKQTNKQTNKKKKARENQKMKIKTIEEEDQRKYEEDLRHDCYCLGWVAILFGLVFRQ